MVAKENKNLTLRVEGSDKPLAGVTSVKGAKNAVSKLILGGALVSDKPFTLSNLPHISEVGLTTDLIADLGAEVDLKDSTVKIDGSTIHKKTICSSYTGVNRIPILAIGALCGKLGSASVPMPGGDPIGKRPIDFHVSILESFGITVNETTAGIEATASNGLRPATVSIPFASVGATEQFLFTAATIPDGVSVLRGAAMEPELKEIGVMLNSMGCDVQFNDAARTVTVVGASEFKETHHHVKADPLVAVSFLAAAITSGGVITVTDIEHHSIASALDAFGHMGCDVTHGDNWVRVDARDRALGGVSIETGPAPEFRTDWQAFFTVAATRAEGTSFIHEKVYANRFVYVPTLKAMGADIQVNTNCGTGCYFDGKNAHQAVVRGNGKLKAVKSPLADIRGAFACVLAAGAAEGTSEFTGVHHLIRGYHKFVPALQALGMNLELAN